MRVYERALQTMVWGIVLCFAWVVFETGVRDWGELAEGFFRFRIPSERNGIAGVTLVLSGLSAAVGVNMVFLYPYTLLARAGDGSTDPWPAPISSSACSFPTRSR